MNNGHEGQDCPHCHEGHGPEEQAPSSRAATHHSDHPEAGAGQTGPPDAHTPQHAKQPSHAAHLHAKGPPPCCAPGRAAHAEHHEMMVADFQRRFWVSAVLTVPVLLLSPMLRQLVGFSPQAFAGAAYASLALSTAIFFYGGFPFLKGLFDEVRGKQPGMMTLIGVAISAAFVYSAAVVLGLSGKVFFWELATLIDVMLLGHWIEMRSVMGASRALTELAKLMPEIAHLVGPDGEVQDVPIDRLRVGDRVLVKPGERVPADGQVAEGRSSVNEAMLTGESAPVEKGPGDTVIGGSINGEGALTIVVEKAGAESYLSQVIRLVEEAQQSKSRSQDLANRAAFWLTVIALGVGAGTLAVWLGAGKSFDFALERTITVMVITCPHALGLAVPLVVAVSTALAASRGLLIRDRAAFERARRLDAVVFDKTGTLTEGQFGVQLVVPSSSASEDEVLRLAAAVEAHSEHPIARAVIDAAKERGLQVPEVSEFKAIPGKGAEGLADGRMIRVVSPGYLRERGLEGELELPSGVGDRGWTVVYVLDGDTVLGAILMADIVRRESREAVQRLHGMGIRAMMLTGDNEQVARWVADELGLDEYFAQVLPHEKAARIRGVQERGMMVAMVGDGVNDAPALVQADVGVAIGAGTDVAVESADVILVRNDPRNVVDMVWLARATWRKMVQNLAWATGYNVVAIPLAAGVLHSLGILLTPAAGAILMSASTVIVAINARLLRMPNTP